MKREVGNSGGGGARVETQGTVTVNKDGIQNHYCGIIGQRPCSRPLHQV